jgi:hypothetical protein
MGEGIKPQGLLALDGLEVPFWKFSPRTIQVGPGAFLCLSCGMVWGQGDHGQANLEIERFGSKERSSQKTQQQRQDLWTDSESNQTSMPLRNEPMKPDEMKAHETAPLGQRLDICGAPFKPAGRILWGMALVGFGILLWFRTAVAWSTADEAEVMERVFAVLVCIIAVWLPLNAHTYLDFASRQIITLKHYAWFVTWRNHRPLTDFSRIVVRHVCHSGGEGADTYTGSVGLKPLDGAPVLWIKTFPTTEDEVPREAYEFASQLQKRTGLPGPAGQES